MFAHKNLIVGGAQGIRERHISLHHHTTIKTRQVGSQLHALLSQTLMFILALYLRSMVPAMVQMKLLLLTVVLAVIVSSSNCQGA